MREFFHIDFSRPVFSDYQERWASIWTPGYTNPTPLVQLQSYEMKFFLFLFCMHAGAALAATVTYNWDITWVDADPDGALQRPVIGSVLLFYS